MSDTQLASSPLQPTGDRVLTPVLGELDRFGYRIVLEGVFAFGYGGEAFDALYRGGPGGPFSRRHGFLEWSPRVPPVESEDVARHRYVFRVPAEWELEGQSVGVRVAVDRFVDEYLIPPSEVRSALAGEVRMTVLRTPLAPASPWPLLLEASVPAALVVGGVGWILRRRMTFQGLSPELQAQLERILDRHRAARSALRAHRSPFSPEIDEQLALVKEGAFTLARQIRDLRRGRALMDRRDLEADLVSLEGRLTTLRDAAARREGELALVEKRETIALLGEMEQAESRCAMRLARIEAALDATCLTLHRIRDRGAAEPAEAALRRELDAEVAAIREVEREVAACEGLQEPGLASRRIGM